MMRSWKVVASLLGFWMLVMIYMSSSVFQAGDGSAMRSELQLQRALRELDKLKTQNLELHTLAEELKEITLRSTGADDNQVKSLQRRLEKATKELGKLSQTSALKGNGPSKEHEQLERKVNTDVVELWYYVRAELTRLKTQNPDITEKVNTVLDNGADHQRMLLNDIYQLRNIDGMREWRKNEANELGNLVQSRLHALQNPKDCSSAKKLVCNLSKGCGYGCQIHHVTYCLIVAYNTQRTLILESKGWRYAPQGWESVFEPLSDTCTSRAGSDVTKWGDSNKIKNVQVVEMPIVDVMSPRPPYLPLTIPEDISERLLRFHGNPPVWWIGQLLRFLTKPNKELQEDLDSTREKMGFKNPIVGVHVRRTDKVGTEAAFHSIEEYMKFVEEYFNKIEARQKVDKRRVYLATDDPSLLQDAKEKFPHYVFVSDVEISKSASLGSRYTNAALRGIIVDIHMLSLCDYLVCTFSSQVCRVAYEMMQTYNSDAYDHFYSLDDKYYFGGQNAHNFRAIQKHIPQRKEEIALEVGDLIGIAGNHWDGYSKGVNRRTGQSGMFPSYKARDEIDIVKMPKYEEVIARHDR